MTTNILLSYPRSGNHLVRFFIELLSEVPTYGCHDNIHDIPIFKNIFKEEIPFNISDKYDKTELFHKYHVPPKNCNVNKLILIVRNPREVLLRQCGKNTLNIDNNGYSYEKYFESLDFYLKHPGSKKLLLYYEDILLNKELFVEKLYMFLDLKKREKKQYVLSNLNKLFELSSNATNRDWGGINSNNNLNFYYKNISLSIKNDFDFYLNNKLLKYEFVKNKYEINNIEFHQNSKIFVVSFCSFEYVELAKIWVKNIKGNNLIDYIVIACDKKAHIKLITENINTVLKEYNKAETFWSYRLNVINSFIQNSKYDYIIHSDIDAIWKKNICEELSNYPNIDIFFSQGTIFPENHLLKHNFVLCCGFFCIKCNIKDSAFLKDLIKETENVKDDQIALNTLLINTKWNSFGNKVDNNFNKRYHIYKNNIYGFNTHYKLNLMLISFLKIQREKIDEYGYIYHLLSPKNALQKIDYFKKEKII